jgi:hypothetical protein
MDQPPIQARLDQPSTTPGTAAPNRGGVPGGDDVTQSNYSLPVNGGVSTSAGSLPQNGERQRRTESKQRRHHKHRLQNPV